MPVRAESPSHEETSDRLARRAFFGFVLTFILSHVVVFLIMARRIPNRFLFLQGIGYLRDSTQ
jgi:hypothetical protein